MSYNMIDFNMYEKIDCNVEQHYHRKFATYQKYKIDVPPNLPNKFTIDIELIHEENEANNSKYAEIVVTKNCTIEYNNLYDSNPFEKLYKGIDVLLNPYYIVEAENNSILLTAKTRGYVPSMQTPKVIIDMFDVNEIQKGFDTRIFVTKQNEIHIPRTTFGKDYKAPKKGDIIYIIDSVKTDRDKTFLRKVENVINSGPCTCDILELNLPIDRLDNNGRVNGVGLDLPASMSNNYTASFNKTQLWKRKKSFDDLVAENKPTGKCYKQIDNFMDMKKVVNEIMSRLDKNSFSYFGTKFHWKDFEELLKPFYNKFGKYLCDELFVLKSSLKRPDYLIHIDYDEVHKDLPVVASFTWPALNCNENTMTIWYECFDENQKIYQYGEQDKVITNDSLKIKEIDRYFFNTEKFNSVILKHNDWHTVYNNSNSNEDRMLLQWRFKPDISWADACKIYDELKDIA